MEDFIQVECLDPTPTDPKATETIFINRRHIISIDPGTNEKSSVIRLTGGRAVTAFHSPRAVIDALKAVAGVAH